MSASNSHPGSNSMIARQHLQIEALLDTLSNRFDAEKTVTRNLVSLINSLAAHLEMHFELEEENEYFGNVVHRAPRLSEQVNQLLLQHKVLEIEVEGLVNRARKALSENDDVSELAARFHKFRKQLLDHEHAEIDLLQEAYTRDLGGGD